MGVIGSLVAAIVLAPLIAEAVVRVAGAGFPLAFGAVGRLSQRNALRNPRRTGATAAALMIGLSLVGGTAVLAASLTTSINNEVNSTFGADYVISGNGQSPVSTEIINRARAIPGVDAVTTQHYALAHINGFQLALSGVDVATIDRAVRPQYRAGSTQALAQGGLAVDETTATANHWSLGSPLQLTFANGTNATLAIGAISKPPIGGAQTAASFRSHRDPDPLRAHRPGHHRLPQHRLRRRPRRRRQPARPAGSDLSPGAPAEPGRLPDEARQQVDTVLYLIYGLLALAIVIAAIGVINTLALVGHRTHPGDRALARHRHLTSHRLRQPRSPRGRAHRHPRRHARSRTRSLASLPRHRALRAYGITALTIPWATIAAVLVGAVLVGLIAAMLPSMRASGLDVLAAIATE